MVDHKPTRISRDMMHPTDRPADRTAAIVTGKGEPAVELAVRFTVAEGEEWDSRPRLKAAPTPDLASLIGTKRGRVRIVGYIGGKSKRGPALCGLCTCGRFVKRRSQTWRRGLQKGLTDGGCRRCQAVDKGRYEYLPRRLPTEASGNPSQRLKKANTQ